MIEKQGLAIAFSLPDHDPSSVRDKVFNEETLNNLNNKNRVKTLIEYLNGLFLTDELTVRYCKEPKTKTENYILESEKLYNGTSQNGMTLPLPVLTFKFLDSTN